MELLEVTTLDANGNIIPLERTSSEISEEEQRFMLERKTLEQRLKKENMPEDRMRVYMFTHIDRGSLPFHVKDTRKMPSEEKNPELRYLREMEFKLHYFEEASGMFSGSYFLKDKFTKRELEVPEIEKILGIIKNNYSVDSNIAVIYNKSSYRIIPSIYEFIHINGAYQEVNEKDAILKISEKQIPESSKKTIDALVESEQNKKLIEFYKVESLKNPSYCLPHISERY